MERNIIRKARTGDHPYAQILRRSIQNPNLSLKAKGLLAYILSLPDDWQLRVGELPKHFTDGRFAIRAAMKELKETGYVKGRPVRNKENAFCGYEFIVFEDPGDTEVVKDKLTRYEGDAMYRQGVDTV